MCIRDRFLYSAGGTMQRVSLAAFVLAMGMLVDNAIVIIDGILVDLKAWQQLDLLLRIRSVERADWV